MTGTMAMASRLLWLLLNILIYVAADGKTSQYLYEGTMTAVLEQNEDNDFETSINVPRLVEFYAPLCGACRNFKKTYDSIAQQLLKEYPEVEVYAVSCAAHKDLCNRHQISGYPTLFAFSAGSADGIYLKRSEMGGSYEVSGIAKFLDLGKRNAGHKSMMDEVDQLQMLNNELRRMKLDAYTGEQSDEGEDEEDGSDEEEDDSEEEEEEAAKSEIAEEEDKSTYKWADKVEDEEEGKSNSEEEEKDEDEEEEEESKSEEDKEVKEDVKEEEEESNSEEDKEVKEDVKEKKEESNNEEDKEEEEDDEEEEEESSSEEEEDDKEENEDSSKEDEMESPSLHRSSKPILPSIPAGAKKALDSARDMDKWGKELLKKRQEYLKKQEAKKKSFLGRNSLLSKTKKKPAGPGEKVKMDIPAKSGTTKLMRANTPGTAEFQDRKKKILERIAIARSQKGLKKLNPFKSLRGKPKVDPNSTPLVDKTKLPFKREVKKPSLVAKVPVVKRMFKMNPEEALIHDASLSLITGLKHGVFMSSDSLDKKRQDALSSWLQLLSVSLPPEWGIHILIDALLARMSYISKSSDNLQNVLKKHPIPYSNWSPSCNGSFSCGTWKLLHILTLGVAEHRGGINLVDSGMMKTNTRTFTPAEAADVVRDYIANFFGCDECRKNFLAQYDQCSFRRCDRLTNSAYDATADDWKQLALWMWEVHNDINVQVSQKKLNRVQKKLDSKNLNGSGLKVRSTGEDEIKTLFPSLEDCIVCFEDSGHWDENSIFEYLERTYWDSPDAKYDRLLTSRKIDDGEDASGGGMIWFMLLLSVAIVFSLRKHLNEASNTLRFSSVVGVKQKLGDAVAGKTRTA
mmetsp:Transcript_16828/g.24899  ORF Transcript_16828/g.24899 Transcript_16828/m.24899 type:complete len:852 (+) Transcript_16828:34-2589(+)